ncbi:MAG: alpha/beta hydrolase [Bacillaceae bacterium]
MKKSINIVKKEAQKPFLYERSNSRTAILFIHGFLEGPNQFQYLIDIVLQREIAVYSILLPGHGATAKEFVKSNLSQWINYVDEQINRLRERYKQIILVGHSMGSLLALNACLENDKQIVGVIAIATPLKIRLTFRGFMCALKVVFNRIKEEDVYTKSLYESYSIEAPPLLGYLSYIPRYLDLFKLVRMVRKNVHHLKVPTLIIHSQQDEFVRKKSVRLFESKLNCTYKIITLPKSGHFYYVEEEREQIKLACQQFIDELEHHEKSLH